jgi:pilus assembly protein Flp/PilA
VYHNALTVHPFVSGKEREEVAMALIKQFLCDRRGATLIEYAFIAALVSVVIVGGVRSIGTALVNRFTAVSNNLT